MRAHTIILFICCIVFLVTACSRKAENKSVYVSDTPTEQKHGDLFLSESSGLNVFYDISASDSSVYCLDFHNDTILKVFSAEDCPALVGFSMKGQGPDDLLFPFFLQNAFQHKNKLKLVDVNTWSAKEAYPNANHSPSRIKFDLTISLPIMPAIKDYNETDSCIYGLDVDMQQGLFFIYNKNEQKILTIDYPYRDRTLPYNYSSEVLPYLFENHLLVNGSCDAICVSMINLNCLYFYDLAGNLKKEIVIGDKKEYPEPDSKSLDFPNAKKYFVSMTGNNEFVYCLCNSDMVTSKIFKFDWEGNLISVIQTDKKLEKISVNPTNKYIYGISMSEEGGSDVYRFDVV